MSFTEAQNHLSGTLTVTNGTQTANLTLLGQYSTGNFHLTGLVMHPPGLISEGNFGLRQLLDFFWVKSDRRVAAIEREQQELLRQVIEARERFGRISAVFDRRDHPAKRATHCCRGPAGAKRVSGLLIRYPTCYPRVFRFRSPVIDLAGDPWLAYP